MAKIESVRDQVKCLSPNVLDNNLGSCLVNSN
jgi:hypothetical protein